MQVTGMEEIIANEIGTLLRCNKSQIIQGYKKQYSNRFIIAPHIIYSCLPDSVLIKPNYIFEFHLSSNNSRYSIINIHVNYTPSAPYSQVSNMTHFK